MTDHEKELHDELKDLYDIGSRSFVLNRDHARLVLTLLSKRSRIEIASKIAGKYINRHFEGYNE